MMALPAARALSNNALTFDAPIPTSISINSEPDTEKKATFASPATALARRVFPTPGGQYNNTPLGILAPSLWYLSGFLRKSTTSVSSCFTSAIPITSENFTFLAFLSCPASFPTFIILPNGFIPPIHHHLPEKNLIPTVKITTNKRIGNMVLKNNHASNDSSS